MSKQDVNMQDTIEDIRTILNLGNYEVKKIALANPNWSESVDGILVLSVYGAQYRLYLKSPPVSTYYTTRQEVHLKTGYIARGDFVDETLDFTLPSGYKELCVRLIINITVDLSKLVLVLQLIISKINILKIK